MKYTELILLESDISVYMEKYMGVDDELVVTRKDSQNARIVDSIKEKVEDAKKKRNVNHALKAATMLATGVAGGTIAGSDSGVAKMVVSGITASLAAATALHNKFAVKNEKENLASEISNTLEEVDGAINSSKGEKRSLLIVRDALKKALKDVSAM